MKRQTRGEERRRCILVAALSVIERGGVAAVTHRTVADAARVPLGSLTYYFDSKDDLLREALLLFVEEETARLRSLGESLEEQQPEPGEVAGHFARALVGEDPGHIAQFELYLEAARTPALREPAAECFRAYEEVCEIALRAAGVPDAGRLAVLFVALADGMGLRRLAAPGADPSQELQDDLVALFDAVAARAPA